MTSLLPFPVERMIIKIILQLLKGDGYAKNDQYNTTIDLFTSDGKMFDPSEISTFGSYQMLIVKNKYSPETIDDGVTMGREKVIKSVAEEELQEGYNIQLRFRYNGITLRERGAS